MLKIFLVICFSLKPEVLKISCISASEEIFFVDMSNYSWKLIGRMFWGLLIFSLKGLKYKIMGQ